MTNSNDIASQVQQVLPDPRTQQATRELITAVTGGVVYEQQLNTSIGIFTIGDGKERGPAGQVNLRFKAGNEIVLEPGNIVHDVVLRRLS